MSASCGTDDDHGDYNGGGHHGSDDKGGGHHGSDDDGSKGVGARTPFTQDQGSGRARLRRFSALKHAAAAVRTARTRSACLAVGLRYGRWRQNSAEFRFIDSGSSCSQIPP